LSGELTVQKFFNCASSAGNGVALKNLQNNVLYSLRAVVELRADFCEFLTAGSEKEEGQELGGAHDSATRGASKWGESPDSLSSGSVLITPESEEERGEKRKSVVDGDFPHPLLTSQGAQAQV